MRDKKKKCICKNCEDCNFFQPWDMTNNEGLRKQVSKCSFQVLFEEIPRIRGSIDGCQQGVNEARNRAVETRGAIQNLGRAISQSLITIMDDKVTEARQLMGGKRGS